MLAKTFCWFSTGLATTLYNKVEMNPHPKYYVGRNTNKNYVSQNILLVFCSNYGDHTLCNKLLNNKKI